VSWWLFKKTNSKNWHVGWRSEQTGKVESKSARTADRQLAKQRAVQYERERFVAETSAPAYSLQDALAALLEDKKRNKRSAATIEITTLKCRHLIRLIGANRDVATWTLADSNAFLDTRRAEGAHDHTISKELGQLKQALYLARTLEPPPFNRDPSTIWPKAALEHCYTPQDTYWTVEQYQAAQYHGIESRLDHVAMYCNTGVRFSELYRIYAHHVDLPNRRVFVDGTKSDSTKKKKAKRWVPLNEIALEVAQRRLAVHPSGQLFPDRWSRSRLVQDMKRVGKRAGVPAMSANDFRRTFATWCGDADVDERVCADWMGHTCSAMIRRVYQQLSEKRAASEGAKLTAFVGGSETGSKHPGNRANPDVDHGAEIQ